MQRKIRYGIIGFGGFAERAIAPAIAASSNSVLVAVQKRSLAAAKQKALGLSIPHAFNTAEALASCPDVDAVFIASANSVHHDQVIVAARAGKHVLVEKPMAMNTAEAVRMVAECEQSHVTLMIGHTLRFSPLVNHVRQLVQSGSLGRIVSARADYFYDARLSRRAWLLDRTIAGGGPIYDIGVHCLDTLRFVLDDSVKSVHSFVVPQPTPAATERTAVINLKFGSGALGSITCSFEGPGRHTLLEIVGTEGFVSAPDFTVGNQTTAIQVGRRTVAPLPETHTLSIAIPDLYVEEVSAFSRCLLEGTPSPVPGIVGIDNQKVLDSAMIGGGRISHL